MERRVRKIYSVNAQESVVGTLSGRVHRDRVSQIERGWLYHKREVEVDISTFVVYGCIKSMLKEE